MSRTKAIIAGGRTYKLDERDYEILDAIHNVYKIEAVLSGGAKGADSGGESWAVQNDIYVEQFFPDWDKHGRAAGPIRNQEMADLANLAIVFPGGAGSLDMIRKVRNRMDLIRVERVR